MFMPEDLKIRPFQAQDQRETQCLIAAILGDDRQVELKKQIKRMFLHPALWVLSGILISVIGISMDSPPVPTAIVILLVVMMIAKSRFQEYWAKIKPLYDQKAEDVLDIGGFYQESSLRRFFLVAIHRNRIVGTAAVKEIPEGPQDEGELLHLLVHPACRRMGIGSRLIKECTQNAEIMGYSILEVKIQQFNKGANRCFRNAGFVKHSEKLLSSAYPLEFKLMQYDIILSEGDSYPPDDATEPIDNA